MLDLTHGCRCLVNDSLLRLKPILAWSSLVNGLRVEPTKPGTHSQIIAATYYIRPIIVFAVRDRLLVRGKAVSILISILRVGQVVG